MATLPNENPSSDNPQKVDIPPRTLWGIITGVAGAAVGWVSGEIYTKVKMWTFDGEVSKLVYQDIMNSKRGAGAALDSTGNVIEHSPLGGFGAGLGSGHLQQKHEFILAESGKFPFARFVKRFGTLPITLGAAAVTGTAATVAYLALAPRKREQPETLPAPQEWQSRIVGGEQEASGRGPGA